MSTTKAETTAEPEPFGSERRSPTGLVPSARKVFGGGGLHFGRSQTVWRSKTELRAVTRRKAVAPGNRNGDCCLATALPLEVLMLRLPTG